MEYQGEHILIGQTGHVLLAFSFISIILCIGYIIFRRLKAGSWCRNIPAEVLFYFHFLSVSIASLLLLRMLFGHYFEYSYVWQYSSRQQSPLYLISAFWAGQEGSFLLWIFFQAVLGSIILRQGVRWRYELILIICFSQLFLLSMVLGVNILGVRIGSSPFLLLRNMPENINSPFFSSPDYLAFIADGNGLNPLLENIWMAIHPPVLFLGYAATLIPFAYVIVYLFYKPDDKWLPSLMPWLNFSVLILGGGILLGGAWAYVALSFGGFWAWDPVENASLVPWLVLVAGLHLIIISRKYYLAGIAAYKFIAFSYILVIYASFLTRSGILGQSSVHSFGNDGLSIQLLTFLFFFLALLIALLLYRIRSLFHRQKEVLLSREFWVLMGGMLLVLSAFQIALTTSIPVINSVFGSNFAPPVNPVAYYNSWQLPFAALIALFICFASYLKYGKNDFIEVLKKLSPSIIAGLILSLIILMINPLNRLDYLFLLTILLIASFSQLFLFIKHWRDLSTAASTISHFGFLVFLSGALLAFSSGNSLINTSQNPVSGGDTHILYKGMANTIGPYSVQYIEKEKKESRIYYRIAFYRDNKGKPEGYLFDMLPSIKINQRMGNVYEPAVKHFIPFDIYTYISYAPNINGDVSDAYYQSRIDYLGEGDTLFIGDSVFYLLDDIRIDKYTDDLSEVILSALIRHPDSVLNNSLTMSYLVSNDQQNYNDVFINDSSLRIRFEGVSEVEGRIAIGLYEKQEDYIVVKILRFPLIVILWAGAIIMAFGLLFSIYFRFRGRR